jgi:diguanylate cyclase (GGDEF)-like protein
MAFRPLAIFVDDESHVLQTIRRTLHGDPVQIVTFTDPGEALAALAQREAAVVVSDLRMPAMSGVQFLERAAEIQPASSRILLTGHADLGAAIGAINHGAIARLLTKPWDELELRSAVLEEAARSTTDRLVSALPAFLVSTISLASATEIAAALRSLLRDTAGLQVEVVEELAGGDRGVRPEIVEVTHGETTVRLALSPSHVAVFAGPGRLQRLRDLLVIATRATLLADARRALEAELAELANVDGLSGVLNRRAFDAELRREVARASRYGSPLAMLLIDIDRFKGINDTYGHQAGDTVISEIGRVLRSATRSSDVVGRYGGDEFAVILTGPGPDQAMTAAHRIGVETARIPLTGTTVTLSIGGAAWQPGMDTAGLLADADEAVYRVKESGRDGVALAGSPEVHRNRSPGIAT